MPTPLKRVCDRLSAKGVVFDLSADLPADAGHTVNGDYDFNSKTIRVGGHIPKDSPEFNLTLAHEIGHFVLHREMRPEDVEKIRRRFPEVRKKKGPPEGWSPHERMEWQVETFARVFLLPRDTFPRALTAFQASKGLRNPDTIWIDKSHRATGDFRTAVSFLERQYQVPGDLVKQRLRDLKLIHGEKAAFRLGEIPFIVPAPEPKE